MDRPDRVLGPPVDSARLQPDNQAETTVQRSDANLVSDGSTMSSNLPMNGNDSSACKLTKTSCWPCSCRISLDGRGIGSLAN